MTSTLPTAPKVGDTFTPVATASSELPVTITVAAGSASVCSISGGVVTFDAVGSCELLYDQAGDASFAAAPQVSQSVTVTAATSPEEPSDPEDPGTDAEDSATEAPAEAPVDAPAGTSGEGGAAGAGPVPTGVPAGQGHGAPLGLLLLAVGIALAGAEVVRREVLTAIR